MRTLVTNGLIARADGVFRGDLLMENETILELGEGLAASGATAGADIVDAAGAIVLPGGVDVHTHFTLSVGGRHVEDDFLAGTRAAAFGGTTCVVEHPGFGPDGCLPADPVEAAREEARGRAAVDYALHGVLQRVDDAVLEAIPALVAGGVPSIKAYMTYAGRLDDEALLDALDAVARAGGLLAAHAENHAITRFLARPSRLEGRLGGRLDPADPMSHPQSRPAGCEAEAVSRLLALAAAARAPVYVVHLSTAAGLAHIRAARGRGQRVIAETCPQYLLLTEAAYARPDGLQYVMAPPLRTDADRAALWAGLADGSIAVAATDHCAFSLAAKREATEAAQGSVFACPGGAAGVETRLPLLFSEGVLKARLTLPRFVEVTATAPARIMGLGRKGRLEPGMDADITLLDPADERVITADTLHQRTDATPFEGLRVRGWPKAVWLRGTLLLRDGQWCGPEDAGREVRREPYNPQEPAAQDSPARHSRQGDYA